MDVLSAIRTRRSVRLEHISDLTNHRHYFRTFGNTSRIRMIDLKKMNLNAKGITNIPLIGHEVIKDSSSKAG